MSVLYKSCSTITSPDFLSKTPLFQVISIENENSSLKREQKGKQRTLRSIDGIVHQYKSGFMLHDKMDDIAQTVYLNRHGWIRLL